MQRAIEKLIWSVTAIAALTCGAEPQSQAQSNEAREPLARIGEQAIYEEDLLTAIGAQLWQLKNQEYDLKSKALTNVMNQRLLEKAAKDQGLTADAYLEQVVDRSVSAPSAGELEAYYLAQKDRLGRPFDEIKVALEQALMQAKRQQAGQDYIDQLRQKVGVTILLNRPKVEVAADPLRLRGNPAAPVTIVEYADFQCPYCQAAQSSLNAVLEKYKGKVRLGFRDFPLRQIHPQAQPAAEASRCAGEQDKFWEYHDLLYTNQARLDPVALQDYARTAGLDAKRFEACVASGKFKAQIESDLQSGAVSGVSGTPAFYINGVLLEGSQPASTFESIIDAELAAIAAKKPGP